MKSQSASFVFRRPLGLVLAGGGSLGAWQAGFLEALLGAGIEFDKVAGFSAGALNAAKYCLGRRQELLNRWRDIDRVRVLRFAPRLRPFSVFSDRAIWESVDYLRDEGQAKRELRRDLIVISLRRDDGETRYSLFTPGGREGWDGPLAARLVASCSVPCMFPPARIAEGGRDRLYIDGGVRGREWLRLDLLAGCKDVLAVEMIRPEEAGRRRWLLWARHDQHGREVCREQVSRGLASLSAAREPPRIFRAYPSRILDFPMMLFRSRLCSPAVDLGLIDGARFLRDPGRFLVSGAESVAAARRL